VANTVLTDSSNVQKWATDFAKEYIRESGFADLMGTKDGAIIRVRNELVSSAGTIVHVPHIARLRAAGVTGSATLKGNEEALSNYSFALRTTFHRKAVNILQSDQIKTEIQLLDAAKAALKDYFAEKLRTDIIDSLQGINIVGVANADGTPGEDSFKTYAVATAPEKNAWLVANQDRVLIGSKKANYSGTLSTDLAKITAANDKLTPAFVSLMKRTAKLSGALAGKNRIMPYKVEDGRELYVLCVDSNGFRDLRNDANMMAANRDARVRGESNIIFADGDLMWDGVVIKEIPEIPTLGAVGNATGNGSGGPATVGTAFLLGRGAITMAYSQQLTPVTQKEDYGFQNGVGLSECRSLAGMLTSFNGVMYGVLRAFHSSEADA